MSLTAFLMRWKLKEWITDFKIFMIGDRVESSQTDLGDRRCFIPWSALKSEINRNVWRLEILQIIFLTSIPRRLHFHPVDHILWHPEDFCLMQVSSQVHCFVCSFPVFLARFDERTSLHCVVLMVLSKIIWHLCGALVRGILLVLSIHVSRLMPEPPDVTLAL